MKELGIIIIVGMSSFMISALVIICLVVSGRGSIYYKALNIILLFVMIVSATYIIGKMHEKLLPVSVVLPEEWKAIVNDPLIGTLKGDTLNITFTGKHR